MLCIKSLVHLHTFPVPNPVVISFIALGAPDTGILIGCTFVLIMLLAVVAELLILIFSHGA